MGTPVSSLVPHLLCLRPTDQACTEEKQRQCSGWQGWLRATPIFKDCHCRVTTAQKADCMDIQRSVFDDYCGNGNISTYKQCIFYFLWGNWYPCFGLLVTSTMGFKARVVSLTCVFHCLHAVDSSDLPIPRKNEIHIRHHKGLNLIENQKKITKGGPRSIILCKIHSWLSSSNERDAVQ